MMLVFKPQSEQRSIHSVPRIIIALLSLFLFLQISWRYFTPVQMTNADKLPAMPPASILKSAFFGDEILAHRLLLLWLQARDTQSGALVKNKNRNYQHLSQWLSGLYALDSNSAYPLMLATRVYSQAPNPESTRSMLDTAHQLFLNNPERLWRWQAEAAVMAKHRLNDKVLALHYARALATYTPANSLPAWARDMQLILLQDLGKDEEFKLLVGGLMASGKITSQEELQWLDQRLQEVMQK